MRRYIKQFMKEMRAAIDAGEDLERLKEIFLQKLSFFQHERFVHLVTTLMVVNALFISLGLIFISGITGFAAVSGMLLILTGFYMEHYFFLENSVQKIYKMYDELTDKLYHNDKDKSAGSSEK